MLAQAVLFVLRQTGKPLGRLGTVVNELGAGICRFISGSKGALVLVINDVDEDEIYQTPDESQIHSAFDALLTQDLSHLTVFECHFPVTRLPTVEWWRQLFSRTPEITALGLRAQPKIFDALNALMPCQVRRSDDAANTNDSMAGTTYLSVSTLLSKLSKLTLEQDDLSDLWLPSHSDEFRKAMKDELKTICHLKRFLRARKNCAAGTRKRLLVELRSAWRNYGMPPRAVRKAFKGYAEFSVQKHPLILVFLQDPRYGWDCELEFNEVEDSLLD